MMTRKSSLKRQAGKLGMARRSRADKIGRAPGEAVHVGQVHTDQPSLTLIEYSVDSYAEHTFASIEDSRHYQLGDKVYWLNVYGLHDTDILAEVGRRFGLHPLVVEDIANTDQRPKVEDYGDYLFIVTRTFDYDPRTDEMSSDQISLVLGKNFVLSFQERPSGKFAPVRERLRAGKGQGRRLGADYLAYALIDAVVDHYFYTIDVFADQTEEFDEALLAERPQPDVIKRIHTLKMNALLLRRALWPLREAVNTLERGDLDLIQPATRVYLRDVHDHATQIIESLELLRDMIAGMVDLYMSNQSNRLNTEMRFLTVIATLFMPLTFIVGVYGMNFENMPELHWRYGYFIVWGVMLTTVAVMGWIFWRRRWF